MTRKEMQLMEAMKLLASTGLPLLAEEVEELALQVDLQATGWPYRLISRPPTVRLSLMSQLN